MLSLMSRQHSFSHGEFSEAINNVIAVIKGLSHKSVREEYETDHYTALTADKPIPIALRDYFALTKDESVYIIYFDFHRFHCEKGPESEGFILPYSRKMSIQVME